MSVSQAEYFNKASCPHIRFVVTPNCNLFCKECQPGGEAFTRNCYFSENNEKLISSEEVKLLAEIALEIGFSPIKITGGEPLTRPDIHQIISACKEIPKAIVNLGTNGLLLDEFAEKLSEAQLDSLNVGLNSLNRQRYKEDTGVDGLSRILTGLKRARELKIPININFVLMKQNFSEIDDFIKLATKYGLNIRVLPLSNLGDFDYWSNHYVPTSDLEKYIIRKYGTKSKIVKPWSGLGSPMSTFSIDNVEVRIINPENGVYYAEFCKGNECGNYPCTDGVWALRIEANGFSKYCFYPRSGRESYNYLEALREGKIKEVEKRMTEDFKLLNSAKIEKIWNRNVEEKKYLKRI